ncbi:MAG: winged helix-turn-helix domain-containing protein [Actinomycetales bacterium]|nr:winged helix-turn-helix domain-containing protein [Actinomycetales bacterium]
MSPAESSAGRALLAFVVENSAGLLGGTRRDLLESADALIEAVRAEGATLPVGAAWRLAVARHLRGEYDLALELILAADPAGDLDAGGTVDTARLEAAHASTLWARGSIDESSRHAEAARDLALAAGDDAALAAAWVSLALVAAARGDRAANALAYDRALEHAERAHDELTIARVRANLGSMHVEEGRYALALAGLDPVLSLIDSEDLGVVGALAVVNRAEALFGLGRLEEALVDAALAEARYRAAGSPMLVFAVVLAAEIHRVRGNAARAQAGYREAIERAESTANAQVLVTALAGLARTLVADDPDEARRLATRALEQPAALGDARAALAAGWVALALGDLEAARERARRGETEAGRRRDIAALGDALELRAELAARGGDPVDAPSLLAEAADIWRETGDEIRLAANRLLAARAADDRAAEAAGREALSTLGVRIDAFRIAGPLHALVPAEAPALEVRLLGSFQVLADGVALAPGDWPSRKSRELVKFLASRGGRPVSRETLAEQLWPGVRGTSARLSVALSNARTALDAGRGLPADRFLRATREQVLLDPDAVAIDIVACSALAAAGLRAAPSDPVEAMPLLHAAAAHYPAPLLVDEPESDWAPAVRERLQSEATAVKRALARIAAERGEGDRAIAWLTALLADDPFDEVAHRDLIRHLAAEGRHGESRRAHRAYAARMAELGVPADGFGAVVERRSRSA